MLRAPSVVFRAARRHDHDRRKQLDDARAFVDVHRDEQEQELQRAESQP
jgi:hypothetical protein